MSTTLAAAALLMGLAGGPHCIAMCGPACAGVVRMGSRSSSRSLWMFHAGRVAGYSAAGAAAAQAVQSFAWLAAQTNALRPVWALFHLMVLAWGLTLLVLARQPEWAGKAGRNVWQWVRPWVGRRSIFAAGVLWAFMPCGLLYSALLVASLSGGPLEGALSMSLFAAGSAVSLAWAPKLLERVQVLGNRFRQDVGTRASGLLLVMAAGWALGIDLAHRIAVWCGLA